MRDADAAQAQARLDKDSARGSHRKNSDGDVDARMELSEARTHEEEDDRDLSEDSLVSHSGPVKRRGK